MQQLGNRSLIHNPIIILIPSRVYIIISLHYMKKRLITWVKTKFPPKPKKEIESWDFIMVF